MSEVEQKTESQEDAKQRAIEAEIATLSREELRQRFNVRDAAWMEAHVLNNRVSHEKDGNDYKYAPYIPALPDEYGKRRFPTIPQAYFLGLICDEALFGGATGGGKSVALLAAALAFVTVPGYNALLLRRTFKQLEAADGLISISHEWLRGTPAVYSAALYRWTFPTLNVRTMRMGKPATLSFGYLDSEKDKDNFQGPPYQYIGFDELTQFPERLYTWMFSRVRKPKEMNIPTRVRAASNPGGEGHDWVKARFIDVQLPGEREFVPSKLDDNPGLDRPAYKRMLAKLDNVTRRQYELGDWDIRPGGNMFKREWFDGARVGIKAVPEFRRIVRYWDLAGTEVSESNPDPDYTCGVLMGITHSKAIFVLDVVRFRGTPYKVKSMVAATARRDGLAVGVFFEQEPGSAGKSIIDEYRRDVLAGYEVRSVRNTGDKVTRARPFSAACENWDVRLVSAPWCDPWIDEHTAFPQKGVHDDQVDASSGAFTALNRGDSWDGDTWARVMSPVIAPTSTLALLQSKLQQGQRF